MTVITQGYLGALPITQGYLATAPLLITATLKAAEIAPPSPASPWSIDPDRTQELRPNYGT